MAEFHDLIGLTLKSVTEGDETIEFETECGRSFKLYHDQDCCEHVRVEEIHGDFDDLIGSPITLADESISSDDKPESAYDDSFTWTFYNIATIKGYVTIRWLGESNGYYSESVDFKETT